MRKEARQVALNRTHNRSDIPLQSLYLPRIVSAHIGCKSEQTEGPLDSNQVCNGTLFFVQIECFQSRLIARCQVPNVDHALHVASDQKSILSQCHGADLFLMRHYFFHGHISELVRVNIQIVAAEVHGRLGQT